MTKELLERVRETSRGHTFDSSDVYDDDDRVDIPSIVTSVIVQQLKENGIPFKMIATCVDGAFGIIQGDKAWRIEKTVGEDFALGRLTLTELFAGATQEENPCKPVSAPRSKPLSARSNRSRSTAT